MFQCSYSCKILTHTNSVSNRAADKKLEHLADLKPGNGIYFRDVKKLKFGYKESIFKGPLHSYT